MSALDVMSNHRCSPILQNQSAKVLGKRKKAKPINCEVFESPHSSVKRFTRSANSTAEADNVCIANGNNINVTCLNDEHESNSTAVAAVKALIAETKQKKGRIERQKRGEYRRYTPEIREAIIQHALRHGTHDAARTFTSSLGLYMFSLINILFVLIKGRSGAIFGEMKMFSPYLAIGCIERILKSYF